MIGMEVPKFVKCPECDGKYNDKKKRRIIDSCGHPRCFSCLVLDNQCTVCKTILNRRRSWISSRDSLLSTDDSQDGSKSTRGSTHELFSKEQYLRRLYSYDPESSEHVNIRRGSFDLHTRRLQDRRTKLGQHSSSALVLPNEIQNSSPTLRKIGDLRRSSLQEFIFPRKISADMQIFSSLPKANVTSSNQGNIKGENQRRQSDGDKRAISQVISPRSSGYWSEMEYYSDQEGNVSQSGNTDLDNNNNNNNNNDNDNDNDNNDNDNKINNNSNGNNNDNDNNDDDNNDGDDNNNNKINNKSNGNNNDNDNDRKENSLLHEDKELESKKKRNRVPETTKRSHFHGETASIKEMNKDVNELTKTDLVLSGRSCAWQNTKAPFPAESSRCVAQGGIRRNSEPDWGKYFDSHSNIRHSILKVTNL